MINRMLAGVGCVGTAALYVAGVLADERATSLFTEVGALASAVALLGLACLQFSERARTRLLTTFSAKP